MFGLSVPEIAVVVVIGVVFFGPTKLPKLGKAVGDTIHEVRNGLADPVENTGTAPVEKIEAQPVKTLEKGK
jgi:sec-independent protein translocase protein TatA